MGLNRTKYLCYCMHQGEKTPTEVDAYLVGDFAVHRPPYAENPTSWQISYGGFKFPGDFRKRADAMHIAETLKEAVDGKWGIDTTEARVRERTKDLGSFFRCTGIVPARASWVVLYSDYIDVIWMEAMELGGWVEWPTWAWE